MLGVLPRRSSSLLTSPLLAIKDVSQSALLTNVKNARQFHAAGNTLRVEAACSCVAAQSFTRIACLHRRHHVSPLKASSCPSNASRSFASSTADSSSPAPLTLVEDVGGIRNITLNNPRKRNALSLALLTELHGLLSAAAESRTVKVIVIGHEGPVFSSGHDLKELTRERGTEYHKKVFDLCSEVMKLVQDVPMPVIAKVDGLATAAGCQLVASCDISVATDSSRFATPGVNVGLFCSTPAVAVARAVPRKVAAEMLFTGDPIDAETALRHGLLSKVVSSSSSSSLDEEVQRIASRIASVSRDVTRVGKQCLYRQLEMDRDEAYVLAGNTMVDNLKLDDGKEGIDAFVEKRKPVWKD